MGQLPWRFSTMKDEFIRWVRKNKIDSFYSSQLYWIKKDSHRYKLMKQLQDDDLIRKIGFRYVVMDGVRG